MIGIVILILFLLLIVMGYFIIVKSSGKTEKNLQGNENKSPEKLPLIFLCFVLGLVVVIILLIASIPPSKENNSTNKPHNNTASKSDITPEMMRAYTVALEGKIVQVLDNGILLSGAYGETELATNLPIISTLMSQSGMSVVEAFAWNDSIKYGIKTTEPVYVFTEKASKYYDGDKFSGKVFPIPRGFTYTTAMETSKKVRAFVACDSE